VYALYYYAPDGHPTAYLRFVFTAFPGVILLAVWPIGQLRWAGRGRVAYVAATVVVAISAVLSYRIAEPHLESERLRNRRLELIGRRVREVSQSAVVIADDRICNHLQFVADVTLYDPATFRESTYRRSIGAPESGGPQIVQRARVRSLADRLGGDVSQAELSRQLLRRIDDALAADRRVLIIAHLHPRRELIEAVAQQLPGSSVRELAGRYDAAVVDRWESNAATSAEPAVAPRPAKLLERPEQDEPRHSPLGLIELTRRTAATRPTTTRAALNQHP
jgi:hypothetical protein